VITANGSRKEKNNNLDSDSVIMIRRFAERTKELRSKCKPKMTQERLAEFAGVDVSTIRRIENTDSLYKVPLYIAQKIASAFGITLTEMLLDEMTTGQRRVDEDISQKIDKILDGVLILVKNSNKTFLK